MSDTNITVQTVLDQSLIRARDLDKTNNRIADSQLLIYLNKGVRYIQDLLITLNNSLGRDSGTITISGGTQEYTLSGNLDNFFKMVENGVYYSSLPLTPISEEDKRRAGTTTTDVAPTCFYITETALGLVPIPTNTSALAYPTLYCSFYPLATTLALSDNMPYKNVLNDAISLFTSQLAMVSSEKNSAEVTAIYNALEQSVLSIVNNRDTV